MHDDALTLTPVTLQVDVAHEPLFRQKGLAALYEKNQTRGIGPQSLKRVRGILARLDAAKSRPTWISPG
jgi:hypothetical protein